MNPVTHLLTGWALANVFPFQRRDRAVVTVAGIAPDIDGIGMLAEHTPLQQIIQVHWFSDYHHLLAHNIGVALIVVVFTIMLCKRKLLAASVAFMSFHLHLFCDLVGSRGPDGYHWPITYLLLFSDKWVLVWQGQWELVSWQNISITIILLVLTLWLAWRRGFSPLEMISQRADARLIETLRERFGMPVKERVG